MLTYIKNRLVEPSTWAGITLAISGGAALASPFSWLAILAGTIGVLTPTGGKATPDA